MVSVVYSIFVVARIQIYREGVAALFGASERFAVVGSATSINASLLVTKVDALLVDCSALSPILLASYFHARDEHPPVIAFGVPNNMNLVLGLLEAGATAYVTDDASAGELFQTVSHVVEGRFILSGRVSEALLERLRTRSTMRPPPTLHCLTAREIEVAELMGRHRSNKEIAATLGITVHTVKVHVHHVIQKLDLQRRGEIRDVLVGIGASEARESRVGSQGLVRNDVSSVG